MEAGAAARRDPGPMTSAANGLSDKEFSLFQEFMQQDAGVWLAPAKKALVAGRLMKRLRHHGFQSYKDYFDYATRGPGRTSGEYDVLIGLITTHETHFFREPQHFKFLSESVLSKWSAPGGTPYRVWSAACSSGEEPYTLAMTLSEHFGGVLAQGAGAPPNGGRPPFEVLASDIDQVVIQKAQAAVYPMDRSSEIPAQYLPKYFEKGVRSQSGTIRVAGPLRQAVRFMRVNLNEPLPRMPEFDVIFLRNVMIYFDGETKQKVVARLAGVLKKGGLLFVGHSETLNGVTDGLRLVRPSVYQK